jgi:hypothetical protein
VDLRGFFVANLGGGESVPLLRNVFKVVLERQVRSIGETRNKGDILPGDNRGSSMAEAIGAVRGTLDHETGLEGVKLRLSAASRDHHDQFIVIKSIPGLI